LVVLNIEWVRRNVERYGMMNLVIVIKSVTFLLFLKGQVKITECVTPINTDIKCRLLSQLLFYSSVRFQRWQWDYVSIIIIMIMVITTFISWLRLKVRHFAVRASSVILISLLSCRIDVIFTCDFQKFPWPKSWSYWRLKIKSRVSGT
jgi:hypothetical protein